MVPVQLGKYFITSDMKLLNDYGLFLEVIFLFVFKHKRICNKAKGC